MLKYLDIQKPSVQFASWEFFLDKSHPRTEGITEQTEIREEKDTERK